MAKVYWEADEEFVNLANEIIDQYRLEAAGAKIFYRMVDKHSKAKGKVKIGSCAPQNAAAKCVHGYDFVIETAADLFDSLAPEQKRAYLLHELLHAGINEDEEGNQSPCSNPHDAEEFALVLQEFGPWKSDLESIAAALRTHDVENPVKEEITREEIITMKRRNLSGK